MIELWVSNRKVADPWFDSRTGNALLRPWDSLFTLIFHWSQAVYPIWWPSLTKDLQTKPKKGCSALLWLDRRRVPGSYQRTNKLDKNHLPQPIYSFRPLLGFFHVLSGLLLCISSSWTSLYSFLVSVGYVADQC